MAYFYETYLQGHGKRTVYRIIAIGNFDDETESEADDDDEMFL